MNDRQQKHSEHGTKAAIYNDKNPDRNQRKNDELSKASPKLPERRNSKSLQNHHRQIVRMVSCFDEAIHVSSNTGDHFRTW